MEKNKVMLVDGMALLFRAYYSTAMSGYFRINSKGVPTNAVHGFVKHLFTAMDHFKPSHVICCWDMGSTTFRTEMYPDYKANRDAPPVELVPQFDLVKEVTNSLNIPNIGLQGYEADDCIGTLTTHFEQEAEVLILTGDQDILQLLRDNVSVVLLQKGYGNYKVYTHDTFLEEKGITPRQIIDLKALMGDSSDNYPGVKGIGEKTALKLLYAHGSVEGILQNISTLTKSQREKIERDVDNLHLSRKLAEIYCQVDVTCSIHEAAITIDRAVMEAKFNEVELGNVAQLIAK
ncbi:5'-3' exonuclease [Pontibacillus litoralis]|uniref:5'-3' exonuclease n=1 Tax=Pontibacillus litoralis JSM 072002 TaxID=1385512 RepID=A0A0A5G1R7_9BACI|nr:5'-3' exonuclease [Pontibacillus litoralis]KGX84990.1 5'-3' exonuclease [Pontibacillus litoralis JSM 072002]